MKTKIKKLIGNATLIVLLTTVFSACQDQVVEKYNYIANVPVYQTYEEFRAGVSYSAAQPLQDPGKIYFKANRIYINEYYKGIHVIDNSNPSAPVNLGFINIPGNVDIAIKGNILYADSYVDLVAIDISDLNNIKVIKRIENVFEYQLPRFDPKYPVAQIDESKGVVKGWKIEKISEKQVMSGQIYELMDRGGIFMATSSTKGGQVTYFVPNATGKAGSMARFIIYDWYLYTINGRGVKLFDIHTLTDPVEGTGFTTTRTIETLFVIDTNLFIGSTTGMLVYSLDNPASPQYVSELSHMRSCDPVVVEGNYAYVTLRAGNACGGTDNQMDVIDISNLSSPTLLKSYPLSGPYGLGIDQGTLFICDGDAGLKIYNASDPLKIDQNIIKTYSDINAYDVIPFNYTLMMIGADGLYQYDYHDLNNITLLSTIPIN